jgi:hypothetical protein
MVAGLQKREGFNIISLSGDINTIVLSVIAE